VSHQRGAACVDGIEKFDDELRPVGRRVVDRVVGQTEARLIVCDGAETRGGEGRQVPFESARGRAERRAVQKDHRRSGAFLQITSL